MQIQTNRYIGLAILVIGVIILINSLQIHAFISRVLLPVILVAIGLHFYRRNHFLAWISFGFAVILFFKINIFGLIIAGLCLYFGYQMIKKDGSAGRRETGPSFHTHTDAKKTRRTLIGEIHYTDARFELEDLTIQQVVGSVKIDLTKAILQNGETVIIINEWIGDIDIYVPYDLHASVDASVLLGDLEIFGQGESGVNCSISIQSDGYHEASKKVKLVLSLLIGDVNVRYL